jgi:hypothetical protein
MSDILKVRTAERHALALTNADLETIAGLIQAGSADIALLRYDPNIKARFWVAVRWQGEWVGFVYDDATRSVLSVLPEHEIDAYRSYLAALDGTSPKVSADGLPEPYRSPEIPPRTVVEAEARQRLLKPQLAAINYRLHNEAGRTPDWVATRERLISNRAAIVAERARLTRMINDTNDSFYTANQVDPARADDPDHLLAAALTAIMALAKQLGHPPGPHYAAADAIRDYLRAHAPLVGGEGGSAPVE